MANEQEVKKLERRARSMLLDRDIPQAKMDLVRSMLHNKSLLPEEKFRAIIELVQGCPEKKVIRPVSTKRVPRDSAAPQSAMQKEKFEEEISPFGPTETSYFVPEIYNKYRHLKLFKKRYLVHRNNRIGVGFRKRLIPGKRLIKILKEIIRMQDEVVSKITLVLQEILNDELIEDPVVFNYLRKIRRWMLDQPLIKYPYESLKWMERQTFERELKNYAINYFSFLRLNPEIRESIILMAENKLRMLDEYKKEDISKIEHDNSRAAKEKRNLEREKKIYELIMALRSFIPTLPEEDNILSKRLKNKYGITHYTEFLNTILEGLVYQRPFSEQDLISYYTIRAPEVNSQKWDYSEDILKRVGKDPESRRNKDINVLKVQLEPYELEYMLLNLDDKGNDILMKAVEEQWRIIDKKKYDPKDVYNENFFNFLDAIVNHFNNKYTALLDGSTVEFNDQQKNKLEGSLFSDDYFNEEMTSLSAILNEMHYFRSNNPTLAITRNEVKKIMKGQLQSMGHVQGFINMIGDFFYRLAHSLLDVYSAHSTWISMGMKLNDQLQHRNPLTHNSDPDVLLEGRPIPFYDCTIKSFENGGSLSGRLEGARVIHESLKEGAFVIMMAFAFQATYECMNERIIHDLEERKRLTLQIKELEKKAATS